MEKDNNVRNDDDPSEFYNVSNVGEVYSIIKKEHLEIPPSHTGYKIGSINKFSHGYGYICLWYQGVKTYIQKKVLCYTIIKIERHHFLSIQRTIKLE